MLRKFALYCLSGILFLSLASCAIPKEKNSGLSDFLSDESLPTEVAATIYAEEAQALTTPEAPLPVSPLSDKAISIDNLDKIVLLDKWGLGTINQAQFMPDGKSLAIARADGIHINNTETGAEIQHMPSSQIVMSLAVSPDGKWIAGGLVDSTLVVWELPEENLFQSYNFPDQFEGYDDNQTPIAVSSLYFSKDGNFIAARCGTKINIWDMGNWSLHRSFDLDKNNGAFFSEDLNLLITFDTEVLNIWSVNDGDLLHTIELPYAVSNKQITLSSDNQYLVINNMWEDDLNIYKITNEIELYTSHNNSDMVFGISFLPNNNILAINYRERLDLWDIESKEEPENFLSYQINIGAMVFSNDGQQLFTTGQQKVWDVSTGNHIDLAIENSGQILGINFTQDNNKAAIITSQNITIRDMNSGQIDISIPKRDDYFTGQAAFSANGETIAAVHEFGVCAWQVKDGAYLNDYGNYAEFVAFSSDGQRVITGGEYIQIQEMNQSIKNQLGEFPNELGVYIYNDQRLFDYKNGYLAFADCRNRDDGITPLRVWQITDGKTILDIQYPEEIINILLSPQEDTLFIKTYDGFRFIDINNGSTTNSWSNSSELQASNFTFSPDGAIVAGNKYISASILFVNSKNGECLQEFDINTEMILCLAFTPDGSKLLIGTNEGLVHILGIP